ncbi:hypothetical protein KVR01_008852 [Diaporthe batatas]|uniref:uncharacterized protein n=1 Tax=Diaporthe batatas TaxID=748121 RepID=UPI001D03AB2B|nr:uncharacterized protein KVR01_008852 [Diaporthe batatas]KAG8161865.1 hypothetical protein KVR01_008852 [Diaporthe batatas]
MDTDEIKDRTEDGDKKSESSSTAGQPQAQKADVQGTEVVPEPKTIASPKLHETRARDDATSELGDSGKAESTDRAKNQTTEDASADTTTLQTTEAVMEASDAFMYRTKPVVRYCDWHEFKNRYPDDDEYCAIETLLASRDLSAEIRLEQIDRKAKERQRSIPRSKIAVTPAQPDEMGPGAVGDQRLERVRINSAFIIGYLSKVTGEGSWNRKPHTFLNPFKIFIHNHRKMEAEFEVLKEKFAASDTQPTADIPSSSDSVDAEKDVGPIQAEASADTKLESFKAYQDMKCYVDFMKTRIMPLYTMFEKADHRNSVQVRYSDIWYLFRPGDILCERKILGPDASEPMSKTGGLDLPSDSLGPASADMQLWRSWATLLDDDGWEVDDLTEKSTGQLYVEKTGPKWAIELRHYRIDFDGEAFAPVSRSKWVAWYEGTKAVTSLPVYPIRFAKDHEQFLQRLQARGEKFREFVFTHKRPTMSYLGWTLTHDPSGERIRTQLGKLITFPEHIDSDVVIDFRETYQSLPPWKPNFLALDDSIRKPVTTVDEFAVAHWAARDRSKQSSKKFEMVVHTDEVDFARLAELVDSGGFLKTIRGTDWAKEVLPSVGRHHLDPEDLALLPCRVFAYSLRDRRFVNADIRYLKPIKRELTTFDKLKISVNHKSMIKSLVHEHFQKKEAQEKGRDRQLEISDQDFIRGKGRGLVMLLHGAPGVGKTATAEAVADVYKKPLFAITCGDLGTEPKEVESNLNEIFRLANAWDCILLLDEAEIFLSPREKRDDNLQRNALVSIFLRILEYYPGILFLTTNRPGALDEAVKSRVHITLFYPQLSKADTVSLFQMNIERLKMIEKQRVAITQEPEMIIEEGSILDFAREHFETFSYSGTVDCRWNGRQIRNAFQIAASLARYEHFDSTRDPAAAADDGGRPGGDGSSPAGSGLRLLARHFKQVERATVEYDEFRKKMLGATDSELARQKEERAPEAGERPPPGARRRVAMSSAQRYPQPTPSAPYARDRGDRPTGQRGGGDGGRLSAEYDPYDPAYNTPRRQPVRRARAAYQPFEVEGDDLNPEYDEDEQAMNL